MPLPSSFFRPDRSLSWGLGSAHCSALCTPSRLISLSSAHIKTSSDSHSVQKPLPALRPVSSLNRLPTILETCQSLLPPYLCSCFPPCSECPSCHLCLLKPVPRPWATASPISTHFPTTAKQASHFSLLLPKGLPCDHLKRTYLSHTHYRFMIK